MSGVLHGVVASLKAAAAAVTDSFFKYVSLLLNTSSTNGAQNNTFLDGSTNAFSITRNGNTTQGTFSPFSQTGWSNYFDGTGDYLSVASNAAFDLGSSDFTIESWVNPSSFTNGYAVASRYNFSGSASGWVLRFVNATTLRFIRGNDVILDATVSASVGVWYHVAVVRNGSTLTIYLNGTQVAQATGIANFTDAATALQIGRTNTVTDDANGYTSNLRIVKGTAVYTATFTPPTSPLTAITNTSLLTCQSNRFIDNSSNAFAITRNGDVSVQAFSPFNPTAAWSASTNGGSGYFDGTGDYLTTALTALPFGTGDFTVEGWLYRLDTNIRGVFQISSTAGGLEPSTVNTVALGSDSGQVWRIYANGTAYNSTATWVTGTWYHFALVRNSGTTTLYINGTSVISQADTTNYTNINIAVGGFYATTYLTNGYISNFRVVNGTAVYTANFTPPTAPLTAITNTSLLLNFTNAGIYDSASGNDLETVGNAQVSTVQAKWGTTSMAFDGTGDWLVAPNKPVLQFGTAPFTIEAWVYPTTANLMCVVSVYDGINGWALRINANTIAWYSNGPGSLSGTASVPSNAWTHLAAVREGTGTNQFKIYVNGVLDVTATNASNFNQVAPCFVGAQGQSGGTAGTPWTGYIDDLRITNGYARYTANFTPPTAAFPLN